MLLQQNLTASIDAPTTTTSDAAPLILLAEDNAANINTTTAYLTAKGYYLMVAKNGIEAVIWPKLTIPI